MTGLLNRIGFYSWKKHKGKYSNYSTIPDTGSTGVCLFVCACVICMHSPCGKMIPELSRPHHAADRNYMKLRGRDFASTIFCNRIIRVTRVIVSALAWSKLIYTSCRFQGVSWVINQWEADLGVVGMAGLGASANLLWPHPVTLHRGIMCSAVKERQLERETLFSSSHSNINPSVWGRKLHISQTHHSRHKEYEWEGAALFKARSLLKTKS